ncbi:hypothetical protein KKE74_01905 [Patescibacteria group bacterium]|nr:hypothetical protein [Patescibacteria group bacterium]MBU2472764.1 hypothetical protein [Patescibacteria group bacterium]
MNQKTQEAFSIISEIISEETGQPLKLVSWDTVIPQSAKKKIMERLTVFLRNAVLTGNYSTIGELVVGISFWK